MDNIYASFIIFGLSVALGFVIGVSGHIGVVNTDCEKYGEYATEQYKLVCTKK